MSPYHFQRMFTRQIGVSPARYVTMKRLQVARWLLRATRAPIGRIATAVGFAGQAHFASAFRRATGLTPRDYRLGEEPGARAGAEQGLSGGGAGRDL
jgi:AraC family transcriptional regulator